MIAVTSNLSAAADVLKDMPALQRKAMVLALNRTAQQAQTEGVRAIRANYQFKTQTIKGTLSIFRATNGRLQATIQSKGRRIGLIEFQARQTKAGVTVRVGKSRKLLKGAFIATMRNGHQGVFMRRGSRRLPINEKVTIAVPEAFVSRAVAARMTAKANEVLPRRFDHELTRLAQQQAPGQVRGPTE
jgi:hypothetical protein